MKALIALLLLSVNPATAQEEVETRKTLGERKHEVKIGAIKLLAGVILEGTYEYIKNEDLTFGVSILGNLDTENDYPEDFAVTPFVRFYFQETKQYGANGFFVEGFGKYSVGKYNGDYMGVEEDYSAPAIGLALGKKWVNKTGFVFEILAGAGRTLGNTDSAPEATFRGDFNIGYRF